ncbi:MAG: VCBS domain-containing protein, partial [Acinetobacter sp.]
ETYSYTLTDKDGDTSTATLTITINGTDDLPVAVADVNSINEDAVSVSGNVRSNDTLGDGTAAENVVSLNGNAMGSYGTLVLNADGTYTYSLDNANPLVQQLAPTETLTETYSYTLTDKDGDTSTATLTITINGVNDAPVIDLDENNSSGEIGNNYRATYTLGGAAVAIADLDVKITDADVTTQPHIKSATITLDNAQTGDILTVGSLPVGITSSVSGNVITLTSTDTVNGSTLADYETAIKAITFSTTTANETIERNIKVKVTDIGNADSNEAISKIAVSVIQAPGQPGGPTNGNDPITGGNGDDVLIGDAGGVKTVLEPGTNYNIAFIIDISGSMNAAIDMTGTVVPSDITTQRMDLVKKALVDYLNNTVKPFVEASDGLGGHVNLTLIQFSSFGTAAGSHNNANNAATHRISFEDLQSGNYTNLINSINGMTASGGTNYEAAFNRAANWFEKTSVPAGHNVAAANGYKNLTFFITDGDPSAYMTGTTEQLYSASITAAQQATTLQNAINAFSDVRDNGGTALSQLSDVHAIGIGPLVKKPWLDFFDNTTDGGDGFIVTTNKTVDVSPVTGWR